VSATAASSHFANNDDLLASVAADGFRELGAAMETGATGGDPLGAVCVAYFDFALQKRDLFRLMFGPMLVERAKYPALNEAASAVFGWLQRIMVNDDEGPREDDAARMGLVMASPSWSSAASSPETPVPNSVCIAHAAILLIGAEQSQ
jgi:hypothetical protein